MGGGRRGGEGETDGSDYARVIYESNLIGLLVWLNRKNVDFT